MKSRDRERVLLYLSLLASPQSSDRFRTHNDLRGLAESLCRLWIEEIYVPGIRNMDGLKAHRRRQDVEAFDSGFSEPELELLYQFHRFMELRLEMLPKRTAEDQSFPGGEFWQNIFRHARNVLAGIDPEGLELEEILRSGKTLSVGQQDLEP